MILKGLLRKFTSNFNKIFRKIFLDKNEKYFIDFTLKFNDQKKNRTNSILIQGVLDYGFLIKQFFLSNYYSQKKNSSIDLILLNTTWHSPGISRDLPFKFIRELLTKSHIKRLYSSFGIRKTLDYSKGSFLSKRDISKRALNCFYNLKSKDELLALKIDGILIGDLIYDTYLRFKPSPILHLKDKFLLDILKASFQIYYSCQVYLKKNNLKLLLTSYSSYIYHGIMTRVCLANKIEVICFGNPKYLIRKLHKDFMSHADDFSKYRNEFANLEDRENKLVVAKNQLERRFLGGIDSATGYMKTSSFSDQELKNNYEAIKNEEVAIIMLHCFFDSPHIYRDMLFPDFLEWLYFVLNESKKVPNIKFLIKPHPNGLPGNEEVLNKIKQDFPEVLFLEKSLSNKKIISDFNCKGVFTVYGTVGHEFPYFRIPVINAGDNPHINYSFCHSPKNRDELKWFIHNLDKIEIADLEKTRSEICEFYYMHNIHKYQGRFPYPNFFGNEDLKLPDTDSRILREFVEKTSPQKINEIYKEIQKIEVGF